MHYIFLVFTAVFFLQGCKPEVQVPKPTELNSSVVSTVSLYNQQFSLRNKAGSIKHLLLEPSSFQGEITRAKVHTLVISALHPQPYLSYTLPEKSIIIALNLRNCGFLLDDDADVRGTSMKTFTLAYTSALNGANKQKRKTLSQQERIILVNKDEMATQSFTLKPESFYVDSSVEEVENYRIYSDRNVSILYLSLNDAKAILEEALLLRKDRALNEALIETIALKNPSYYRELLAKKSRYNLPKKSIVHLPKDALISYAVTHLDEIYLSGKYKTTSGRYKILIQEQKAQFDRRGGTHKRHSIRAKKSKKRKKAVGDIPEGDNFIDFSKGL